MTGRFYMREYTVEEQVRTSYELEATAVGHDLSRGTTQFTRVFHSSTPAATVARDENGLPTDDSDRWLDLAGSDADAASADGTGPALAPAENDRELAAVS